MEGRGGREGEGERERERGREGMKKRKRKEREKEIVLEYAHAENPLCHRLKRLFSLPSLKTYTLNWCIPNERNGIIKKYKNGTIYCTL